MAENDPERMKGHARFHGRMDSRGRRCAWPGCDQPGEFRAPGTRTGNADGPGEWRWLCLDHVRAFNAAYNYFRGMSPDEIAESQRPFAGWERETRAFAHSGADLPPRWADFADPLDAIGARFRATAARDNADGHALTKENRQDLKTLGLAHNAGRNEVRRRYADLVRSLHPDHNGGDRRHEARLRAVITAYQRLRKSAAFI